MAKNQYHRRGILSKDVFSFNYDQFINDLDEDAKYEEGSKEEILRLIDKTITKAKKKSLKKVHKIGDVFISELFDGEEVWFKESDRDGCLEYDVNWAKEHLKIEE